jgi:membrane protein
MGRVVELVKSTFKDFSDDEATWKAAALAYYTVFALPPLLVLLLQIASTIWDPEQVRRALTGEFQALMGQDVARQIQTMVASAERKTSGTGLRLAISIGGLVFGATGVFISLQSALNRAWEVQPDPEQGGIRNFITKRFLSLGMVLGIAFLLLVSMALTSLLSAAGGVLLGGLPKVVGDVLNYALSFAVVTLLFAGIFKLLPDAKIAWRDVWVGAVVTAALFTIGKFAIGIYVGRSDPGNAFGAASALAVLLVWIYYAAIIILLGAEFTQAWVKQKGRDIEPKEGAVRVVERSSTSTQDHEPNRGTITMENDRDVREESAPMAAAKREVAATRELVSDTIDDIEAHISGSVASVKRKVDVVRLVRENPWPALAGAVVAGVALSATGADRRAARATARAAKRAPDTAKQGATRAAHAVSAGVSQLASAAADRFKGGSNDSAGDDASASSNAGVMDRLKSKMTAPVREIGDVMRSGVEELP